MAQEELQRHLILGTAGHIDHGKTSLIKALTGVDTDRLPEEKRRGMTIELGFAELAIDELVFGIVDVPGHEKFVRTMVAGATGIDLALIVVAADDAVMPQTIEHVEILDLLGVRQAVVALNKSDLVDAETLELAEADIRELLAPTAFAEAPIVPCSAVSGAGVAEVRAALRAAADHIHATGRDKPFRMPIDRVFTVAGRGTVVTGSVVSGTLHTQDTVTVLPVGDPARVRALQSHGRDAESIEAGQRAAVNVQGIDKEVLARGCELAAVDSVIPARLIDAHLRVLPGTPRPLGSNTRVRLCLGTREVCARCVMLEGPALGPGEAGFVQLRATEPVAAAYDQRFIVRAENGARTLGGGVVLRSGGRRISARMAAELAGLKKLLHGSNAQRVAEVLRAAGFAEPQLDRLAYDAGVAPADVESIRGELLADGSAVVLEGAKQAISAAHLAAVETRAERWLQNYHQAHPDEPGCLRETFTGYLERKSDRTIARQLLSRLLDSGAARAMGRYICLKAFAPELSSQDEKTLAAIVEAFAAGAYQPPGEDELLKVTGATAQRLRKLLKLACALGDLVEIDRSLYLHADREADLRQAVIRLADAGGPFTVSQLRQALDSSRKYVVPLAEYLDRIGFTRRIGDRREIVAKESA